MRRAGKESEQNRNITARRDEAAAIVKRDRAILALPRPRHEADADTAKVLTLTRSRAATLPSSRTAAQARRVLAAVSAFAIRFWRRLIDTT
jgi:hypothetical protein